MLVLTGCGNANDTKKPSTSEKERVATEYDDYITKTFKDNGKNFSFDDVTITEDEGVVIAVIKEYNDKLSVVFSKLKFEWNGSADKAKILYLMVSDKIVQDEE